ncbi:MAG TPA: BrnT family toxin [Candidatus Wujingus californicus]|uniref:BrnT family toxin n=1 Tax=Candidatus Wujingus californicus TaxID=3367618 RepID=UPI001D5692C0|nr:BrnT family toxin [Planctomycetota bacterium]MDO8130580.1 BrnT family toxin [Candidatus Brocadiales bacterium]
MDLTFEWDEEKAKENLRKHKIDFTEAKTIFNDPFSITITDPEHSIGEYRYVDIGQSSKGQILVIVYTDRMSNIRIISCRKATKSERRIYEEGVF